MATYNSWAGYPKSTASAEHIRWRSDTLPRQETGDATYLPFGNGRSYGDVCLNQGGVLLDVRQLSRFISFDQNQGFLRCEAGVLLSDILQVIVPQGWFLPVTPGTQYVTVGGAIANDVHGKNHHQAGTFGCHVRAFELLRSNGKRMLCKPDLHHDWFAATIGGLGLTGLITWAEIQLVTIPSAYIREEALRVRDLSHFMDLTNDSDKTHEYTAGWIDCLTPAKHAGKGVYFRANFCDDQRGWTDNHGTQSRHLPFSPGRFLFNRWSLKRFNSLYAASLDYTVDGKVKHYRPVLYPLDGIQNWNIAYGKAGFLQYQCVVPMNVGIEATGELLQYISDAQTGSFLSVLKVFGKKRSPGLLSFPQHGITLALDFPLHNPHVFALLDKLDQVVMQAGGAVYPAKDARMSSKAFFSFFPQWPQFEPFIDPEFSSDFLVRVVGK